MRKLYEIESDLEEALNLIDPETGEWLGADKFAGLTAERDAKLEGVAISIKQDAADMDALDREIQNLTARRDRISKARAGKISWLSNQLNGQKFSTSRVDVTFRKSTSVQIDNEEEFCKMFAENPQFVTHKEVVTDKPNRVEIAKYIKSGGELTGTSLIFNYNMKVN